MFGYGPKLPLARDPIDGFTLTKDLQENIQQNLKNLLLTSPGERIMIPNFGVGVRRYLFEQRTELVIEQIKQRIHSQVETYMSFVVIGKLVVELVPIDLISFVLIVDSLHLLFQELQFLVALGQLHKYPFLVD